MTAPTPRERPRELEQVRITAVELDGVGLLGVGLGALGDGDHGVVGPEVDGLAPVEPVEAAGFNRYDFLGLRRVSCSVLITCGYR